MYDNIVVSMGGLKGVPEPTADKREHVRIFAAACAATWLSAFGSQDYNKLSKAV